MSEPIRVLCVFSTLNRGGAESMCMNLYRNINREKVQFDFVKHSHDKGAFEDEIVSLGGRIFEAPRYRIYNHIQYKNWWKAHFSGHPEHRIIHGHFFRISPVYFSVAHKFNLKTIGHSHSTMNKEKGIMHVIRKLFENAIEGRSDYCLACGQDAGKWLFPHKPYTVLNNAIDTESFLPSYVKRATEREGFHFGNDTLVVGTVGHFSPPKNPLGIVDVFKALYDRNPHARLLWVGDGSMRTEIEEKISLAGLENAVVLTGMRSDVADLLQAMDAFVLPSLFEGLPVVAIEAQASGLQCFISDRVTRECDITGRCRFLPIDQPELWADTILSTDLSRADTQRQIIDAGYDIHTTANWLTDFYLNIAKE